MNAERSTRPRSGAGIAGLVLLASLALPHRSTGQTQEVDSPQPGAVGQSEQQRAGNPRRLAPWAIRSPNCRYRGYYVGGGTIRPRFAEKHTEHEGTWGLDFIGGRLFHRRVQLSWLHGKDAHKPHGSYHTDGPHLLKKK